MCAGDRRENTVKTLRNSSIWRTRNGSTVVVQQNKNGFRGTVIESKDRTYPVGAVVAYKSEMGHVLCEGTNDHSCELHAMDAEVFDRDTYYPQEHIDASIRGEKQKREKLIAAL